MSDPFLDDHDICSVHFDIGGSLEPFSIRDQMVRAQMIIDHAIEPDGLDLKTKGLPILIIGAGAAGVTAAMRAVQNRISVDLVECEQYAFTKQAGINRWIEPALYDWPMDHWTKTAYPWAGPGTPISWNAGVAKELVSVWRHYFTQARKHSRGYLRFHNKSWVPECEVDYSKDSVSNIEFATANII